MQATVPLGPQLTEEQARALYAQGEEAVVFALLALAKLLAEQQAAAAGSSHQTPATPSGMRPPYAKPAPRGRGGRTPGRQAGHPGSRRPPPQTVHERKTHRADACPDCGGPLNRCAETRTRYTEDVPEDLEPVVTEHTVHRDWCPACRKKVEGVVPDALPGSALGHRVLVLTAWLHYALGNTLSQVVEVFNFHLPLKLSPGGLVQTWYRLQAVLYGWYEQIQAEALDSGVLHADETGWRVNGKTHWLWCFANPRLSFYMVHQSRGSPALLEFFTEEFDGILVSDFWGAYNAVACALRQTCLVHLLRDMRHVEQYKDAGDDWPAFAKKLRRLVRDAVRLWRARGQTPPEAYARRRDRLHRRLAELVEAPWRNKQARRLVKRLRRHRADVLTFVDHEDVPFENNHAEREIRPAVVIRKNSYGSRSQRGADCQAVLMTIYRTLRKRGHHPVRTVVQALRTHVETGQLPPLPK